MTTTTDTRDPFVRGLEDCFSPSQLAVSDAEVARHLGLPSEADIDASLKRNLQHAVTWFHESARPWCAGRVCEIEQIEDETVLLRGGTVLHSDVLARGFREAGVESVAAVAVSAGAEIDREIERHFADGHPDEAMTLNAFAIAAVEHVRAACCHLITERAKEDSLFTTPYYSPGYEGWPLEDQRFLFAAIAGEDQFSTVRVLESGGLEPTKSTLFSLGLTPRSVTQSSAFWQHHAAQLTTQTHPEYAFAPRTLKKWCRERLSLGEEVDGCLTATFRTSGSTCANMGLPLSFHYRAKLERGQAGEYRFADFDCEPAENDTNHRSTCQYLSDPDGFAAGIKEIPPLLGKPLADALHWNPDVSPAGCLCLRSSRDHKWRIVVQTLHYALTNPRNEQH